MVLRDITIRKQALQNSEEKFVQLAENIHEVIWTVPQTPTESPMSAQRMNEAVRSNDLVARHGGEEFLIVLPGCDKNQIQECAERIRSSIASEPVIHSSRLFITVSIGAVVAVLGTATETDSQPPMQHCTRPRIAEEIEQFYRMQDDRSVAA